MQTRIGALVQDLNMLVPYAGEFFSLSFFIFSYHNVSLVDMLESCGPSGFYLDMQLQF